MAVEAARGCGYRKVGGVYLVGGGTPINCDRLPFELVVCPTCGGGLKFSRGITWVNWHKYAGEHREGLPLCNCPANKVVADGCPVCYPKPENQPYGLIWIGEKFYSADEFIKEALQLGISRRIPVNERLPKNLKIGETWILFAHIHVTPEVTDEGTIYKPAVFYAFKPERVEKLIWKSEATKERLEELEEHGITPVVIPDGDKDHDPSTPIGLPKEEKAELKRSVEFNDLRNKLKRTKG